MRDDRKGFVSIVDAMIFVTLIAVVSMCLFSMFITEYQEEPMANSVCDGLISIELKSSDVFDTEDSDVYHISDLIASGLSSGKTAKLQSYISKTVDGMIPGMHGYSLTVTYRDKAMSFERDGGSQLTSEYSTDVNILNGSTVRYELKIY